MLTIQMPNHFDSMYNRQWISPWYSIFQNEWNPWGDEELARLQLMRFNLARSCAMYDSEMQRLYWNHLSWEEKAYAEASYDYYKSLHDDYFVLEMARIKDTHLERDLKTLEMNWQPTSRMVAEAKAIFPANITESDWMRGMIRSDVAYMLVPPSSPFMNHYLRSFLEPGVVEAKPLVNGNQSLAATWRNKQALNQMNLIISSSLWGYELVSARPFNQLKGVSGQNSMLLTNHDIPIPKYATFPAWFTACGFGIERVDENNRKALQRLCGFTPRVLLTYIVPMIPRTKEHGLRSTVGTDDSHADHSLPARSSGHSRDSNGRINYGMWVVRTVLIGNDDGKIRTHVVAHNWLDDAAQSAQGFHKRAKLMIPWTSDYSERVHAHTFDALWNIERLHLVTSHMMDPYQANRDPMTLPIFRGRDADLGMRAISKQLGIHFRFDEWESAIDWCTAFELCAYHYSIANQNQINASFFEAIMGLTTIPSPIKEKRKFNLDSLDGAL